jgi:hypothetical protein
VFIKVECPLIQLDRQTEESMNIDLDGEVEKRLLRILSEIAQQEKTASGYGPDTLSFADEMEQIREWIDVREYGLAYESLVVNIEQSPFVLSGATAIALLEVGLVMGYKTDRDEDAMFRRDDKGSG